MSTDLQVASTTCDRLIDAISFSPRSHTLVSNLGGHRPHLTLNTMTNSVQQEKEDEEEEEEEDDNQPGLILGGDHPHNDDNSHSSDDDSDSDTSQEDEDEDDYSGDDEDDHLNMNSPCFQVGRSPVGAPIRTPRSHPPPPPPPPRHHLSYRPRSQYPNSRSQSDGSAPLHPLYSSSSSSSHLHSSISMSAPSSQFTSPASISHPSPPPPPPLPFREHASHSGDARLSSFDEEAMIKSISSSPRYGLLTDIDELNELHRLGLLNKRNERIRQSLLVQEKLSGECMHRTMSNINMSANQHHLHHHHRRRCHDGDDDDSESDLDELQLTDIDIPEQCDNVMGVTMTRSQHTSMNKMKSTDDDSQDETSRSLYSRLCLSFGSERSDNTLLNRLERANCYPCDFKHIHPDPPAYHRHHPDEDDGGGSSGGGGGDAHRNKENHAALASHLLLFNRSTSAAATASTTPSPKRSSPPPSLSPTTTSIWMSMTSPWLCLGGNRNSKETKA